MFRAPEGLLLSPRLKRLLNSEETSQHKLCNVWPNKCLWPLTSPIVLRLDKNKASHGGSISEKYLVADDMRDRGAVDEVHFLVGALQCFLCAGCACGVCCHHAILGAFLLFEAEHQM